VLQTLIIFVPLACNMTHYFVKYATLIPRVVFVGGGEPGNFPLTGSDLPSPWFV